MKTNYHTHSNFCDGINSPREYILKAIESGIDSLGFSSHAPIDGQSDWTMLHSNMDRYIKTIRDLKKEFKDKINIHLGLEIDYLRGQDRISYYRGLGLDYCIGAIHIGWLEETQKWHSFDSSIAESKDFINIVGSPRAFYTYYYSLVRELITAGGFEILAHIDLIKKFNKDNILFLEDDKEYYNQVTKTLDLLMTTDIIMEINTGVVSRGYRNSPYPSQWILEESFKRGIKVCLNSDCHSPDKINYFFDEALELIKKAGYTKVHTPFEEYDIRSL